LVRFNLTVKISSKKEHPRGENEEGHGEAEHELVKTLGQIPDPVAYPLSQGAGQYHIEKNRPQNQAPGFQQGGKGK
jgi:hypothetical protein